MHLQREHSLRLLSGRRKPWAQYLCLGQLGSHRLLLAHDPHRYLWLGLNLLSTTSFAATFALAADALAAAAVAAAVPTPATTVAAATAAAVARAVPAATAAPISAFRAAAQASSATKPSTT